MSTGIKEKRGWSKEKRDWSKEKKGEKPQGRRDIEAQGDPNLESYKSRILLQICNNYVIFNA